MVQGSSCSSVIHTLQIDLATAGSLHTTYLAGGTGSYVLFFKKSKKSNWFSVCPHPHSLDSGVAAFGAKNVQWKLGRQGDYLLSSWLRVVVSAVTAADTMISGGANQGQIIRWCHNLGHNLIECAELSFTGIPGAAFDSFFLDFFAAFTVPAGKRNVYDNMIGNIPELVNPIYDFVTATANQVIPDAVLNIPLPMPYCRESGVALPTGALIYNDVILHVDFRDYTDLLVVSNPTAAPVASLAANNSRNAVLADVDAVPTMTAQLWGHYAVVSTDERKRMGKIARDLVWENVQTMSASSVATSAADVEVPLRYSHAVKTLFFAIRNKTITSDRSNYTTRPALARSSGNLSLLEFPAPNAFDPIKDFSLCYEGSQRLNTMAVDYFSMLHPYYFARSVPGLTGYHCYSYSLDFADTNHLGSVDYGKLTNVTAQITLGDDCVAALGGTAVTPFYNELGAASVLPPGYYAAAPGAGGLATDVATLNAVAQKFEVLNCALAHSVLRVIGGAAGFPIF